MIDQPVHHAHQTADEPGVAPTAGIDWAIADHAVAVVDPGGIQLEGFTIAGTALRAFANSTRRLGRAGVEEVAMERPDGPVVDALLAAGFGVVVIAPNQLKNLRGRYGSAGNKDDAFDAYVLADVLRTDRARLQLMTRDSEATVTLRMTVRARRGPGARTGRDGRPATRAPPDHPAWRGEALPRHRQRRSGLAFLCRFPSQDKADWLSGTRLANWLRSVGYGPPGQRTPTVGTAARTRPAAAPDPTLRPAPKSRSPWSPP